MNKIAAIVQARMGSTRLPCKSLLTLRGTPIIDWIVTRLGQGKLLDAIVVAVPDTPLDKVLQQHLAHRGINYIAGSENDVLDRFAQAAKAVQADTIIRVCADNPLISGEAVDRLIEFYGDSKVDYAWNHIPRHNLWPDGLGAEIVGKDLLLHLHHTAKLPAQREHCFNYIWDNIQEFKTGTFDPVEPWLQRPDIKLDIDTPEDYTRLALLPFSPTDGLHRIIDVATEQS